MCLSVARHTDVLDSIYHEGINFGELKAEKGDRRGSLGLPSRVDFTEHSKVGHVMRVNVEMLSAASIP